MVEAPRPPQGDRGDRGGVVVRHAAAAFSLRDLHADWLTAMRSMAAANVSLYVIDPVGLRPMADSFGGDSGFANETGGYAFLNTNDLRGAAERIFASRNLRAADDGPAGSANRGSARSESACSGRTSRYGLGAESPGSVEPLVGPGQGGQALAQLESLEDRLGILLLEPQRRQRVQHVPAIEHDAGAEVAARQNQASLPGRLESARSIAANTTV